MDAENPGESRVVYNEETYLSIYREIVKRVGSITAATITRMKEEDFKSYEPGEAVNRLIIPITGLFGQRLMHGILVDALSNRYSEGEAESMADEMLK